MGLSPRFLRLLKFIIPIFVLVLIVAYLLTPEEYLPLSNSEWQTIKSSAAELLHTGKGSGTSAAVNNETILNGKTKEEWIQGAADWEIDGTYNDTALYDLCETKDWNAGLVFKCAPAYGGIGNVRNIVLNCLTYGIEAGATTLIVPKIGARDADLLKLQTGTTLPFTYMFDEAHFISTVSRACPQIQMLADEKRSHRHSLPNRSPHSKQTSIFLHRSPRPGFRLKLEKNIRPLGTRHCSRRILSQRSLSRRAQSRIIRMAHRSRFPSIHRDGRVLRFHPQYLKIAGTVLYALEQQHNLGLDPTATGVPAKRKFYGAHLRTDVDALAAHFASFAEQSAALISATASHYLNFIYLASGSSADIKQFTLDSATRGLTVVTKDLLLSTPEFADVAREMKALAWDQQALVDYMVLLRSSYFSGTWASSFAWNITFRRHVAVLGGGEWAFSHAAQWKLGHPGRRRRRRDEGEKGRDDGLDEGVDFMDDVSAIFGPRGMGMWFELAMWP